MTAGAAYMVRVATGVAMYCTGGRFTGVAAAGVGTGEALLLAGDGPCPKAAGDSGVGPFLGMVGVAGEMGLASRAAGESAITAGLDGLAPAVGEAVGIAGFTFPPEVTVGGAGGMGEPGTLEALKVVLLIKQTTYVSFVLPTSRIQVTFPRYSFCLYRLNIMGLFGKKPQSPLPPIPPTSPTAAPSPMIPPPRTPLHSPVATPPNVAPAPETKTLASPSQAPTELVTQNLLFQGPAGDATKPRPNAPPSPTPAPSPAPVLVNRASPVGQPATPAGAPVPAATPQFQPGNNVVSFANRAPQQPLAAEPPRHWFTFGEPTLSIVLLALGAGCYVMAGVMTVLYAVVR
uniref:Type VI secretion system tip protein VgrG n=1 Tax=Panagrellus redivivus TaxID=6233 RepID=A0A7E4VSS9_PANRE